MTEVIHSDAPTQRRRARKPRQTPAHWVPWRNREENRLVELYPTAPKADICAEFPSRTWLAICLRARVLGIRRLECMPRNENLHPVVHALLNQRILRGMRQSELARLIGWEQPWLNRMERGRHIPSLPMLDAWAAALEMQITIAPILHCAAESATNQE